MVDFSVVLQGYGNSIDIVTHDGAFLIEEFVHTGKEISFCRCFDGDKE